MFTWLLYDKDVIEPRLSETTDEQNIQRRCHKCDARFLSERSEREFIMNFDYGTEDSNALTRLKGAPLLEVILLPPPSKSQSNNLRCC